jgi:hypothetical protein
MGDMKDFATGLILFVLASPILLVQTIRRAHARYRYLQLAARPAITCQCGEQVSLVGLWRCSCGFTYRGHLLRLCPVCGTVPCVIRCYRCGVTSKLPDPV